MRQFFTSPRLENVEALEKVLEDAGIATRVSNRATWRRGTKRDFSYTDRSIGGAWPALWVVNADDYPQARQILKDAGLLESTRPGESSYLPKVEPAAPPSPRTTAERGRWIIFIVTLVLATLVALKIGRLL
jgi:hypothetical protein